jgi:hypothetical protein
VNNNRPKPGSQAGRILKLLEDAKGGKVPLPAILALKVSQYNARIHDLRHRFGFRIENGAEPGRPDHTFFRLLPRLEEATLSNIGRSAPSAPENPSLFSQADLAPAARWHHVG